MTVWMNVTFTYHWVGPACGIARQEREIAVALENKLSDNRKTKVNICNPSLQLC